ncbi:MAG: 6-carboxytetrahydropterin synthase QueD [Candidatus Omnitrophota bacterium]|nr:MAG: 6-carboxytetrahydropterin synthase QueD [Candidatus Omnitrophota bacterium]
MFKIKVQSHFSSAHFLRDYKGKCENLHGHNWKVEVVVASVSLNSSGMVMDFSDLRKILNEVVESLDHKHLNDLEYFSASAGGGKNPSSEEIARYIYNKVKEKISNNECRLQEVRIWETESSCATYQE